MDIWNFLKPSAANFQTFENYFSGQPEIAGLGNDFNWVQNGQCQAIISGKPGSGVTHLLHAISNKWIEAGKKVLFTTGQTIVYILKKIESEEGRGRFKNYLLSFDNRLDKLLLFFFFLLSQNHIRFCLDSKKCFYLVLAAQRIQSSQATFHHLC